MPMRWIPSEQLFARKLAFRFSTMRCVDGKVSEPRVRNTGYSPPVGHHKPKFVNCVGHRVPDNGGLAVYQPSRKRNFHDASPRNWGLGGLSAGPGRHGASA